MPCCWLQSWVQRNPHDAASPRGIVPSAAVRLLHSIGHIQVHVCGHIVQFVLHEVDHPLEHCPLTSISFLVVHLFVMDSVSGSRKTKKAFEVQHDACTCLVRSAFSYGDILFCRQSIQFSWPPGVCAFCSEDLILFL